MRTSLGAGRTSAASKRSTPTTTNNGNTNVTTGSRAVTNGSRGGNSATRTAAAKSSSSSTVASTSTTTPTTIPVNWDDVPVGGRRATANSNTTASTNRQRQQRSSGPPPWTRSVADRANFITPPNPTNINDTTATAATVVSLAPRHYQHTTTSSIPVASTRRTNVPLTTSSSQSTMETKATSPMTIAPPLAGGFRMRSSSASASRVPPSLSSSSTSTIRPTVARSVGPGGRSVLGGRDNNAKIGNDTTYISVVRGRDISTIPSSSSSYGYRGIDRFIILPRVLQHLIVSMLPCRTLCLAASTSRLTYELLTDDLLWKRAYIKQFDETPVKSDSKRGEPAALPVDGVVPAGGIYKSMYIERLIEARREARHRLQLDVRRRLAKGKFDVMKSLGVKYTVTIGGRLCFQPNEPLMSLVSATLYVQCPSGSMKVKDINGLPLIVLVSGNLEVEVDSPGKPVLQLGRMPRTVTTSKGASTTKTTTGGGSYQWQRLSTDANVELWQIHQYVLVGIWKDAHGATSSSSTIQPNDRAELAFLYITIPHINSLLTWGLIPVHRRQRDDLDSRYGQHNHSVYLSIRTPTQVLIEEHIHDTEGRFTDDNDIENGNTMVIGVRKQRSLDTRLIVPLMGGPASSSYDAFTMEVGKSSVNYATNVFTGSIPSLMMMDILCLDEHRQALFTTTHVISLTIPSHASAASSVHDSITTAFGARRAGASVSTFDDDGARTWTMTLPLGEPLISQSIVRDYDVKEIGEVQLRLVAARNGTGPISPFAFFLLLYV
jgi:hypothetical protein